MSHLRNVYLSCRIHCGGFSSERVCEVQLLEGGPHYVAAPVWYCFDANGNGLEGVEPPAKSKPIQGFIEARRLGREGAGSNVYVPSGDVLVVADDTVVSELPNRRAGNDAARAAAS